MKKSISIIAALLLVFGMAKAGDSHSDNHTVTISIPNIALLDIETTGDRNFSLVVSDAQATEAGNPLDFSATNNTSWLNYTSIVNASQTRKIQASISGTLPSGVTLTVAAASTTSGFGVKGTGSTVNLSATAANLITGIGSVYTQDGTGKGSNLTYSMTMADAGYSTLEAKTYPIVVTYTIVAE